jgi:uncharacterized membrane protein YkoI
MTSTTAGNEAIHATDNARHHHTMKIHRSLLTVTLALIAGASFCGIALAAEDSADALLARLKESKHTLAQGVTEAEKSNGVAISAKFEIEDGKLWLSVYTAKAGLEKDAEHNALIELKGDATQQPWKPGIEVFEDKKHLTRAAMQLTLVQAGKMSLLEIIEGTKAVQAGDVYSVIPAVKNGKPVFIVKVATKEGKSVELALDAENSAVVKDTAK